MREEHRKVLRVQRKWLMDNGMSLNNFLLPELESKLIITPLERKKIEEVRPSELGVGKLLDFLVTKSDDGTFDGLCRALIVDGQRHVAKRLRDEEENVLGQDEGAAAEAQSSTKVIPSQTTSGCPSSDSPAAVKRVSNDPIVQSPYNDDSGSDDDAWGLNKIAKFVGSLGQIQRTFERVTGDEGETVIEGRHVKYCIKGRVSAAKWIYDAFFTDKATGITAISKGYESKEGAYEHGRDALFAKLKNVLDTSS